jgi:hypothetical protein
LFLLARPSTQPHPLPATSPPLAHPFIPCPLLVLADRASAARPASSSTLSRHTPPPTRTRAATHLHTTAPCARSTLFIAAPHSFHHHLHFTPLAPASRSPTSTSTHHHTPLTATPSSLRVFRQHVSPLLFVTPPTRSRSRCQSSRREYVARSPLLAGRLRVGWWVLVPGRVGRRKPSLNTPSFPPLLHAPPRARSSPPRAAYLQRSTRAFGATKAMRASMVRGVPIHIAHTTRYGRQREEALARRLSCHCCVVVKVGHHVRHVAKYRVVTCRGWASTGPPSPRCGCRRPLNRAQSSVANYNAQLVCWLRVCS